MEAPPKEPEATASEQDNGQYKTELEVWEMKAEKANAILPHFRTAGDVCKKRRRSRENWEYSTDRFRPTNDITLSQALSTPSPCVWPMTVIWKLIFAISRPENFELRSVALPSLISYTVHDSCSLCRRHGKLLLQRSSPEAA